MAQTARTVASSAAAFITEPDVSVSGGSNTNNNKQQPPTTGGRRKSLRFSSSGDGDSSSMPPPPPSLQRRASFVGGSGGSGVLGPAAASGAGSTSLANAMQGVATKAVSKMRDAVRRMILTSAAMQKFDANLNVDTIQLPRVLVPANAQIAVAGLSSAPALVAQSPEQHLAAQRENAATAHQIDDLQQKQRRRLKRQQEAQRRREDVSGPRDDDDEEARRLRLSHADSFITSVTPQRSSSISGPGGNNEQQQQSNENASADLPAPSFLEFFGDVNESSKQQHRGQSIGSIRNIPELTLDPPTLNCDVPVRRIVELVLDNQSIQTKHSLSELVRLFLISERPIKIYTVSFWIALLLVRRAPERSLELQLHHFLALEYGKMFSELVWAERHDSIHDDKRDTVLRLFPSVTSQVVFYAMTSMFPQQRSKIATMSFRKKLLRTFAYWMTGVDLQVTAECTDWLEHIEVKRRGEADSISIVRQALDTGNEHQPQQQSSSASGSATTTAAAAMNDRQQFSPSPPRGSSFNRQQTRRPSVMQVARRVPEQFYHHEKQEQKQHKEEQQEEVSVSRGFSPSSSFQRRRSSVGAQSSSVTATTSASPSRPPGFNDSGALRRPSEVESTVLSGGTSTGQRQQYHSSSSHHRHQRIRIMEPASHDAGFHLDRKMFPSRFAEMLENEVKEQQRLQQEQRKKNRSGSFLDNDAIVYDEFAPQQNRAYCRWFEARFARGRLSIDRVSEFARPPPMPVSFPLLDAIMRQEEEDYQQLQQKGNDDGDENKRTKTRHEHLKHTCRCSSETKARLTRLDAASKQREADEKNGSSAAAKAHAESEALSQQAALLLQSTGDDTSAMMQMAMSGGTAAAATSSSLTGGSNQPVAPSLKPQELKNIFEGRDPLASSFSVNTPAAGSHQQVSPALPPPHHRRRRKSVIEQARDDLLASPTITLNTPGAAKTASTTESRSRALDVENLREMRTHSVSILPRHSPLMLYYFKVILEQGEQLSSFGCTQRLDASGTRRDISLTRLSMLDRRSHGAKFSIETRGIIRHADDLIKGQREDTRMLNASERRLRHEAAAVRERWANRLQVAARILEEVDDPRRNPELLLAMEDAVDAMHAALDERGKPIQEVIHGHLNGLRALQAVVFRVPRKLRQELWKLGSAVYRRLLHWARTGPESVDVVVQDDSIVEEKLDGMVDAIRERARLDAGEDRLRKEEDELLYQRTHVAGQREENATLSEQQREMANRTKVVKRRREFAQEREKFFSQLDLFHTDALGESQVCIKEKVVHLGRLEDDPDDDSFSETVDQLKQQLKEQRMAHRSGGGSGSVRRKATMAAFRISAEEEMLRKELGDAAGILVEQQSQKKQQQQQQQHHQKHTTNSTAADPVGTTETDVDVSVPLVMRKVEFEREKRRREMLETKRAFFDYQRSQSEHVSFKENRTHLVDDDDAAAGAASDDVDLNQEQNQQQQTSSSPASKTKKKHVAPRLTFKLEDVEGRDDEALAEKEQRHLAKEEAADRAWEEQERRRVRAEREEAAAKNASSAEPTATAAAAATSIRPRYKPPPEMVLARKRSSSSDDDDDETRTMKALPPSVQAVIAADSDDETFEKKLKKIPYRDRAAVLSRRKKIKEAEETEKMLADVIFSALRPEGAADTAAVESGDDDANYRSGSGSGLTAAASSTTSPTKRQQMSAAEVTDMEAQRHIPQSLFSSLRSPRRSITGGMVIEVHQPEMMVQAPSSSLLSIDHAAGSTSANASPVPNLPQFLPPIGSASSPTANKGKDGEQDQQRHQQQQQQQQPMSSSRSISFDLPSSASASAGKDVLHDGAIKASLQSELQKFYRQQQKEEEEQKKKQQAAAAEGSSGGGGGFAGLSGLTSSASAVQQQQQQQGSPNGLLAPSASGMFFSRTSSKGGDVQWNAHFGQSMNRATSTASSLGPSADVQQPRRTMNPVGVSMFRSPSGASSMPHRRIVKDSTVSPSGADAVENPTPATLQQQQMGNDHFW